MAIIGILVGHCMAEGWSEQFLQLTPPTQNGLKHCKINVDDQFFKFILKGKYKI